MRLCTILVFGLVLAAAPLRAQTTDLDPRIQKLIASVSEQRLEQLLRRLQSFETRNTMSSTDSPTRGIGAARQWILEEMTRSSSRLRASFDTYHLPKQGERILKDVELRNVMAILPGKSPRRIYISGHYDSLARDPKSTRRGFDWLNADNFAPGANDDGSGTVLTMELARVFAESGIEFDATLVFIAFAGEEQGLIGAKAHAQKAAAENVVIDAVLNNDMVGNSQGGGGSNDSETVRVFSEGPEDSPSRQIARFVRRWASRYYPQQRVELIARHDRFGRGGDHTAFTENGYSGVRITEANEDYSRQHTVEDTLEGVDFTYLARNARVNAAAVAVMALAPPAPVVERAPRPQAPTNTDGGTDGESAPAVTAASGTQRPRSTTAGPLVPMLGRQPSGYDARLQWQTSPGASRYRIFWRRAWTPDWEHDVTVENVTEYVMPNVSIDDYVFGVAAIDAEGHESLVSAYVNPPRREERVIVK